MNWCPWWVWGTRRSSSKSKVPRLPTCPGRIDLQMLQDLRFGLELLSKREGVHHHRAAHAGSLHRRQHRHLYGVECRHPRAIAAFIRRRRCGGSRGAREGTRSLTVAALNGPDGAFSIVAYFSVTVMRCSAGTFPSCCFTPLGHSTWMEAAVSLPSPKVSARSLCEQ